MSSLIEAAHYIKIETIYQRDLLVQISDTLLTFAWFHTWEDKSVKIVMETLFENQYTKEIILIRNLNCPRTIKTMKILGLSQGPEEGVVSLYDLSSHRA